MELSKYISDLLYRYECVIVPDFGGFITNKKTAVINTYSATFYPPSKSLTYNGHLKNNDGLLANYIASVDKVPFDSAMNFLKFEVIRWKEELKKSDLFLEKIGKFTLIKNDVLSFEPVKDINYFTSAFGLSPFVTPEINRQSVIKPIVKTYPKTPIIKTHPKTPIVKKATPVVSSISKNENETTKKGLPNYLKYAAFIALGIGIVGISGNEIYKNNQQLIVTKKLQKQTQNKIEQATFFNPEMVQSITFNVALEKQSYHVIAGAFRYPENAKVKVNQLIEKGYNAKILGVNEWGLTLVSFDSYNSKNEAINSLNTLKKTESNDAWLLVEEM